MMTSLEHIGPLGLNRLSAVEAKELMVSGQITSEQLVKDCILRINARDQALKVWQYFDPEYAIEQAKSTDNNPKTGILSGIPIGIKDNFDTKDMPTEYGTSIYPGNRTKQDSLTVQLLRNAGAIILGKTVTSEFAGPYPGRTLNPYNQSHSPGVSSMGSAAGVADFMMPLANGTQTGGSVIRPASLCGIYGYKGSFNHLSGDGIKHLKPSIDTLGHFARSMDDLELMRCALKQIEFIPLNTENITPPRVGLCLTDQWSAAKAETIEMIEQVKITLSKQASSFTAIDLPNEFTNVMKNTFDNIRIWELIKAHSGEISQHLSKFNPWFQSSVKIGQELTERSYIGALQEAEETRSILRRIFLDIDILVTPSALGEAPTDLLAIEPNNFNNLWTLMYTPCVNIPAYRGPQGLPVGIQIVGAQDSDRKTLEYANWVDKVLRNQYETYPKELFGLCD